MIGKVHHAKQDGWLNPGEDLPVFIRTIAKKWRQTKTKRSRRHFLPFIYLFSMGCQPQCYSMSDFVSVFVRDPGKGEVERWQHNDINCNYNPLSDGGRRMAVDMTHPETNQQTSRGRSCPRIAHRDPIVPICGTVKTRLRGNSLAGIFASDGI